MSLVLVLMLAVGAPAPVADPQARALELYDQGRFAEAAAEFERLAQSDPSLFFEAGQMRFAAGHMAHASRHFQAYIATGLTDDARSIAQARLTKATAGTRRIDASLTPTTISTQIVASRVGDPAGQERPEFVTAIAGHASLQLDPGTWELRVEKPGYLPLRQTVEVGETNAPLTLRLVPVPAAVTAAPAPVVNVAARNRERRKGRAMTAAGAVMLPLGVVALGGFVAAAVGYRRTGEAFRGLGVDGYLCNDLAALGELHDRARRQAGAMVGLGVASGALLSAGTVLLVRGQRTLRRPRLAFNLRPGQAGLLLSGSF